MSIASQWYNRIDLYQYTPWFMLFINGHITSLYFSLLRGFNYTHFGESITFYYILMLHTV